MAFEKFDQKKLSESEKGLVQMRTITNYGMGFFMIIAGCFFMFPIKQTAAFINTYDPLLIKIFAAICWLYGGFRIYRGYKKNYFRNS